jgi:hypothetical protein
MPKACGESDGEEGPFVMMLTKIRPRDKPRLSKALSLSNGHNCPPLTASHAIGGSLFEISTWGRPPDLDKLAPRGEILAFTLKARRRCLKTFASLDQTRIPQKPIFLTLTYPLTYPADWGVWKRHLQSFWKRLERAFPNVAGIWRIELQARGAPHFHILLFGVSWLKLDVWRAAWHEIVGNWPGHGRTQGMHVKRVKHWRQAAAYTAKYLAKSESPREAAQLRPIGRHWGVRRKERLPVAIEEIELCPMQYHRLRRITRDLAARTHQGRRRPRGRYHGGWLNVSAATSTQLRLTLVACPCPFHTDLALGAAKLAAPIGKRSCVHWQTSAATAPTSATFWK